jgi:ABC-type branched-subunit amino acid transport system substrate-binding protein
VGILVFGRSPSATPSANVVKTHLRAALAAMLLGLLLAPCLASPASAATAKAQAILQNPPVKIAVLVTTNNNNCFVSGMVPAIKHMARIMQTRINETTGVAGRRLVLEFLDDEADGKKTVAQIKTAIADKQTVAMIGLSNANRAKETFDTIGADITASGMPWLSNISVNSLFENFPTIFTMRGALEDDSIPVMSRFVKDLGIKRPAFVGLKDQVSSSSLRDGLKERLAPLDLVADFELPSGEEKLQPAAVKTMVGELKDANPDFVFLNLGGNRVAPVLKVMEAAGITPPMLVTSRLDRLFASGDVSYAGDVYQLAWDGLPDAFNDRVRRQMFRSHSADVLFETGLRNSKAPGWKDNSCQDRPAEEPNVLSADNMRVVGAGLQFSDMIGLVAEALRQGKPTSDIGALRAALIKGVKETFASGHGAYPGELEDWSFRPSSRAAARTPFIIMHPHSLADDQLAPIQYVALRNDTLRQIHTLYLDIDLTRAFRVDDKEKSFFAEFYLAMHAEKDQGIDQIEFANAFLDPDTNSKQITVRPLFEGGESDVYPSDMKIYAVSGKFMFNPNFGNYPFDTQRFSIDLRSKSGDAPFIIQPSPRELRDQIVDAEGWQLKDQYVGYDGDFLPVIDAKSHERSVVPFYKASFVWVMKREATDYFLTVVVPLAFIIMIAYLAIFIPGGHFEAIVTIQVTALLSAVALYLTIPKVNSEEATISDKIFLFNYMLTSMMIGISIMRVNRVIDRVRWLDKALGVFHVVVIPLLVLAMALYVLGSSQSEGQTASALWPALRQAVWGQ